MSGRDTTPDILCSSSTTIRRWTWPKKTRTNHQKYILTSLHTIPSNLELLPFLVSILKTLPFSMNALEQYNLTWCLLLIMKTLSLIKLSLKLYWKLQIEKLPVLSINHHIFFRFQIYVFIHVLKTII